ncbi:MAG: 4-hydroxythreonine-4-phosphate dehydrogenase PdxA [Crocinitomicaceae bacterium]|jgi:4-hydroxythreonine-4-phosphate dehydrogenase|nr:4-hydroxythreonine-4-phosphate dehydrogenase PdxA [Crocinitomicaceae bacterium]
MEKENEVLADIRVGITIGDINGIGPEVIIKAFADNRILQGCTPVIYASAKTLSFHKKNMHGEDIQYTTCKDASDAKRKRINVVQSWDEEPKIELGKATEEGGKYAFLSLEKATKDLTTNKIDVLVTAPISKETIAKAGFQFPGHTEYLADMAGAEALMMMVAGNLRVALVTTHVALKEVSAALTKEMIAERLSQVEQSLKKDFGILRPKIAVLGMNPHASENGKMGDEEANVIVPGMNLAKNKGILAFGPFPADGFFGSHARNQYDAVLAMYHDQGLAPFKALAFDEGVNYTAGLPIVRTSPDHGTAFDIAGTDQASASSFREAIYLAIDVYRMRKANKEINANPLPISPKEKRRSNQRDIE